MANSVSPFSTPASPSMFDELSKAIEDVKAKKVKLDEATDAAAKAAEAHRDSLYKAKALREQIDTYLNGIVPLELKPKIR